MSLELEMGAETRAENVTVCLSLKPQGLDHFWKAMIGAWSDIASELGN